MAGGRKVLTNHPSTRRKPQWHFSSLVLQFFTNAGEFLCNVMKFPKYVDSQVFH